MSRLVVGRVIHCSVCPLEIHRRKWYVLRARTPFLAVTNRTEDLWSVRARASSCSTSRFELNVFMRNNKHLLYSFFGFVGGAGGALLAEIVPLKSTSSAVGLVLHTGLWSATFTAVLTFGLFSAGEIYNRHPWLSPAILRKALPVGAIAGAIAGAAAQAVYTIQMQSVIARELLFKPACWGLMGGLLGWRLVSAIPNLGLGRGVTGGAIGGFLGGLAFVATGIFLPETLGRMVGVGLLGAALGLAIVTIEAIFREAYLEVVWAPKEVTYVTLGSRPVFIGGGDDHVYVRGLSQNAATVALDQGKIYYTDKATGKRTELKNGSKLHIGSVMILIKAK